ACHYFRVALSPAFNAAHRDHFHFDRGILWTCQ
ncbi:MAG: extensin family protein, partial [Hyphomicrobiaceae bacterium]